MIGGGFNSDNTQASDGRRNIVHLHRCADCPSMIRRGLRCAPCRDIHEQQARSLSYRLRKLRQQQLQISNHQS